MKKKSATDGSSATLFLREIGAMYVGVLCEMVVLVVHSNNFHFNKDGPMVKSELRESSGLAVCLPLVVIDASYCVGFFWYLHYKEE